MRLGQRPRQADEPISDDDSIEDLCRPLSATYRPARCPPERWNGNGYNLKPEALGKRQREIARTKARKAASEEAVDAAELERARRGLDQCPDCGGWKHEKHPRCDNCRASRNSRCEPPEAKRTRLAKARATKARRGGKPIKPKRSAMDDILDEVFAKVVKPKGAR